MGVVDAHVIPGNLSLAQPVTTSQLSDSDSSGTLLNSIAIRLTMTVVMYLCHKQSSIELPNGHKSLVSTSDLKEDMERYLTHPILIS